MKKKKTLALLGCGALLLSGMYFSNSKNENTNQKINQSDFKDDCDDEYLDGLLSYVDSLRGVIYKYEVLLNKHVYFEPYTCENKLRAAQEEIMFLGASLDSCIIVND
jgi:hypothetical protein